MSTTWKEPYYNYLWIGFPSGDAPPYITSVGAGGDDAAGTALALSGSFVNAASCPAFPPASFRGSHFPLNVLAVAAVEHAGKAAALIVHNLQPLSFTGGGFFSSGREPGLTSCASCQCKHRPLTHLPSCVYVCVTDHLIFAN